MSPTIIITECKSPWGKYWVFNIKGTGERVAEVDRTDGGYTIFAGSLHRQVGKRSGKDSAFSFAKRCILDRFPEAEFKHNVIVRVIR